MGHIRALRAGLKTATLLRVFPAGGRVDGAAWPQPGQSSSLGCYFGRAGGSLGLGFPKGLRLGAGGLGLCVQRCLEYGFLFWSV